MRPAFVRVWDPFVRVFHWTLVASFALAWITADEWDFAHEAFGYAIATLVGLRVIWGVIGTRHARFSDFVYKPSVVIGFIHDSIVLRARRYLGHNPAGGVMVVALLLALLVTTGTGILSTSDAYRGLDWAEGLHEIAANLTIALVVLHVAGVVLASLEHRENLIRSMFTGRKRSDE